MLGNIKDGHKSPEVREEHGTDSSSQPQKEPVLLRTFSFLHKPSDLHGK